VRKEGSRFESSQALGVDNLTDLFTQRHDVWVLSVELSELFFTTFKQKQIGRTHWILRWISLFGGKLLWRSWKISSITKIPSTL